MKAITICQPYASAIIHGPKRVENRMNHWRFRGRLLVHAGRSLKYMGTLSDAQLADWPEFDEGALTFGCIIGSVEVYKCTELKSPWRIDHWATGPWCLHLRDPIAFERPIPYRGQLGLFDVPDDLIAHEIKRIEAAITQK